MSAAEIEPMGEGELLFRRIPASQNWHNPKEAAQPSPYAFRPREHDTTGLSLSRARFCSIEEDAARGTEGKAYYVAVLSVEALRAAGIVVVPRPLDDNPGHAEIPSLTYGNRKSDASLETESRLAELCQDVKGPFPGKTKRTLRDR